MTVILGDEMERGNVTHMTYLATIFFYWFRRYQAWLRVGNRNLSLTVVLFVLMVSMTVVAPRWSGISEYPALNYLNAALLILMVPFFMIGLHECQRQMRQWADKSGKANKAEKQMKDWK